MSKQSCKVYRRVGRPALPQGEKRVQIAARVTPETAAWLKQEKDRLGVSLGAILDDAVAACRVIVLSGAEAPGTQW